MTTAPYVVGSDTSRAAADSLGGEVLSRLEALVLDVIWARGSGGATDDEVEVVTELSHQCASARRVALVKRGLVVDSMQRRETRSGRLATVWVAEPKETATQPPRPRPKRPDAATMQSALADLARAVNLAKTVDGYAPSEELREMWRWLKGTQPADLEKGR